ncbi:DUF58 domain-containing protein [Solwaraspora sp. WMMB335]|uniref:DUF58 domain-containing protein n=1 Tax=Solwaraspora sp. WMMB335 TaxID=3404118 RepID=UPI003B92300E
MTVTVRGIGMLAAGVVLVSVGCWLSHPEAAAVGVAAVLAVPASLVVGLLRPRPTASRTVEADRVARGDTCRATLTVGSASRWSTVVSVDDRYAVAARQATPPDARRMLFPAVRLSPGVATVVHYDVPTDRRGLVRLGPLRAGWHDPLGLTRVEGVCAGQHLVRVHPRRHTLAAMPDGPADDDSRRAGPASLAGSLSASLRQYTPGDDLRHVHWRSSVRLGELMVRERASGERPAVLLLLDDRAGVHHGDTFEHACEATGSLAASALREGRPLHLLTVGGVRLGGLAELAPYLDLLAEADPHAVGELSAVLAGTRGFGFPVGEGLLVYVTGRSTAADLDAFAGLSGLFAKSVAVAFGPQHERRPGTSVRLLAARDGADFASRWTAQ